MTPFPLYITFLSLSLGHALFPFSVSRLVSRSEICNPKRSKFKIEPRSRERVFHPHWLSSRRERAELPKSPVMFFSYFQGAQGEPGTKGERGDPGLPVSPTLHQVFIRRSNLIRLTRDIARSCLSRTLGYIYLEIYRVLSRGNLALHQTIIFRFRGSFRLSG